MAIRKTTILENSVRRLFPNVAREQAIAELLLERAQRHLIKYQAAARHFEAKYGQDFQSFRAKVLGSDVDEETEQDYFDWELAVTGGEDMRDEIRANRGAGTPGCPGIPSAPAS
jgi:hypothetical protein